MLLNKAHLTNFNFKLPNVSTDYKISIEEMFKEKYKQQRHVKFKGTMTKRPIQKQTHITAQKHVNTKTQQTFRKQ